MNARNPNQHYFEASNELIILASLTNNPVNIRAARRAIAITQMESIDPEVVVEYFQALVRKFE